MIDYARLMEFLSVPRPNGSEGERKTRQALREWLQKETIPHNVQHFRAFPYYFECIGVWLLVSRTLLAWAVWQHWGWPALLIAVLGMVGGTLDVAFHLPLVTWPGFRQAENIILTFGPQEPAQEVVFSAHYDTKTELLDHQQRMFLLKNLKIGLILTLIVGVLSPLETILQSSGSPIAEPFYWLGVGLTIPLLLLAWSLGLNFTVGRFLKPSLGAVDNGTSCAVLLGLAHTLQKQGQLLQNTRVTIALFTGEEVNLQGSRAYVAGRSWPKPCIAINLEVMAQDGPYVVWDQDGSVFRLAPTDSGVNERLQKAVKTVTGVKPVSGGPIISDGASFLSAGIPTGVLGTYDTRFIDTGFHRPTDCMDRVVMDRLPEGVEILKALLNDFEGRDGGVSA